jgi:DNA-binding FrmR family transcriptional regulator
MYEIPELLDSFYMRFTFLSGHALGIPVMMRNNRPRKDVLFQINALNGHMQKIIRFYDEGLRKEIHLLSKPPVHPSIYTPEELSFLRQVREQCPSYLLKEMPLIIEDLLKIQKFYR